MGISRIILHIKKEGNRILHENVGSPTARNDVLGKTNLMMGALFENEYIRHYIRDYNVGCMGDVNREDHIQYCLITIMLRDRSMVEIPINTKPTNTAIEDYDRAMSIL